MVMVCNLLEEEANGTYCQQWVWPRSSEDLVVHFVGKSQDKRRTDSVDFGQTAKGGLKEVQLRGVQVRRFPRMHWSLLLP